MIHTCWPGHGEELDFSGVEDKEEFDGNTLSIKCEDNEYVYISGIKKIGIKTDDRIIDYICLTGNNMCPYAIIIREKIIYFIAYRYKFFENDKIEEGTFLNSPDPIVYHVEKCGKDVFNMLDCSLIHTFRPVAGEDAISDVDDEVEEDEGLIETQYLNGDNEVVKIFNQKCVI